MQGHFRAFSLVDRITRARGRQAGEGLLRGPGAPCSFFRSASLPKRQDSWPPGWRWFSSISACGPWPGWLRTCGSASAVQPGKTLDLETTISNLDNEAVRYSARASMRRGISRSSSSTASARCCRWRVSTSPQAMRERFELICGKGAPSGQLHRRARARPGGRRAGAGRAVARHAAGSRRRRCSSPITFRVVRCFPARCCWTRRFSMALQLAGGVAALVARRAASPLRACRT